MKLRQKLAAVMAATMMVTSVPVLTTAASTNTITRPSTILAKGESYMIVEDAPAVKINFDSFEAGEEFYLTLTDAEWLAGRKAADGRITIVEPTLDANGNIQTDADGVIGTPLENADVKITRIDSKVIKVEVAAIPRAGSLCASADKDIMKIPMLVKLTGGEASVGITTEGSGSSVTEGKLAFATTADQIATVIAGDPTSINKEGNIATITIAESYAGAMNKTDANHYALIELNTPDYKFDMTQGLVDGFTQSNVTYELNVVGDNISFDPITSTSTTTTVYKKYQVKANFTYGFSGTNQVAVYVSPDCESMYVELPNAENSTSKGRIELNNLFIESTVKSPVEGNITVDVSGNVQEANDLVVATNGNYDAKITVADDKAVEILAGSSEKVNFTIQETVDGTFTNTRSMDVRLDNGHFMNAETVSETNKTIDETKTLTTFRNNIKVTHNDKAISANTITDIEIEDDKVVGFTFKSDTIQTQHTIDKVKFELNVVAGIEHKGDVKVTVESRDFNEAISAVIAQIKEVAGITYEAAVLKTGLMDQEAGKITITESEAGMLNRSEDLYIYLPAVKGINFATSKDKLPEVKVTAGDIQISDVKVVDTTKDGKAVQAVKMTVKRNSKEASTIEISNFHIDTDRTVAEGKYTVSVGGKALTDYNEVIDIKDFIVIGTANTEDLVGANGLAKGTSTFVIGESKYTFNGQVREMDGTTFAQAPGYTMVPVRYVAEAFGVTGNNIMFNKGVATIFAGTRTIQLTNNSDIAIVNGVQVKMATKVVMKDGRTYAPISEVGQLLGISKSWDNATKTATFTNK